MKYALFVLLGLLGVSLLLAGCTQQQAPTANSSPPAPAPQPAPANTTPAPNATANTTTAPNVTANTTATAPASLTSRCMPSPPGVNITGAKVIFKNVTYNVVECPAGALCNITSGSCND